MPNTPAGPAAHLYAAIAATIQVPPPSAPSLRPLAQTPVRRIAASGAPPVAIHGPSLAHLNPTRHYPCPPQRATAPALQPAKGKRCLALSLRDTPHTPPLCFALLVLLDLQLQPRAPRFLLCLVSSSVSGDSPLLASSSPSPYPHLPASSCCASRRPVPVLH
ncbi:hypothetical protein MY4038_000367 [Beauveria bassiana]